MTNLFIVPESVYLSMVDHGNRNLPNEACGILAGNQHVVKSIWKLQNELPTNRRFFVSQSVVANTLEQIDALNQEVIAIYHTHPTTNPIPSHYDIRNHTDPAVKMVIISYKNSPPHTEWYKIENGNVSKCFFMIQSNS